LRITSNGAAVLGACLVALISGCGGGDDGKASTTATSATDAQTTATTATTSIPASSDSTKTPQAALQKLWHQLQIGSVPTAALSYDRRISARLGSSTLVGALRVIAQQYAQGPPVIDKITVTPLGALVEVHRDLKESKKKQLASYLVRKPKGRTTWVVAYDSSLANGIMVYVRDKEQRKINSNAKNPSPRAIQRAKALVSQYDALFAPQ
jgi:hypothetical protein